MSFKKTKANLSWVTLLFLGVTLFVCAPGHSEVAGPAAKSSPERLIPAKGNSGKSSQENLDKQLQILRKQQFFGKGKHIGRRYERLQEEARKAFDENRFERASLIYYTIVENPEFAGIIDMPEMEFRLIQSLYHANEDYASLDYINRALMRGAKSPHFLEVFRILVDTLNRTRDWNDIDPIMQTLQKQQSSLPGAIREEANYLFGRMSFFQNEWAQAKTIFNSVSSNSRFHSRAVFHLGVIAAREGDYPRASKLFSKAYDISKKSTDFIISEADASDRLIKEEKQNFQDLCILALSRILYTTGKPGKYSSISARSPYYPVAIFESGWSAFGQRKYEEALKISQDFTVRFPAHGLYPEALLLSGHANMEAGRLETSTKEFRRFVDIYEPLIPMLKFISQSSNPRQAVEDFNNQSALRARPELYAWAFEGPNLDNIRRALTAITTGEKGIETNREAWKSIGSLVTEEKKIRFPSKTKINMHPKITKSRPGATLKDQRLTDLEKIENELKRRIVDLEASLKGTQLDKGRRMALEKAVATERQRLTDLQEKTKAMRARVAADRSTAANTVIKSPEQKELANRREFDELITAESAALPAMQEGLRIKRDAFQNISAKIVQKRIGALMQELTGWVRKAYIGEIEIAFIRREKTKGEEQQTARREVVALINNFLKKYPGAPEVPDQWFRLAELAYEESKQKYFANQAEFEKQYDQYSKGLLKTEPKEPRVDYSESIEICRRLLKEFPNYPRKDRVLYVLGYYYDEQEMKEKSLETFRQLVEEFPKSEFALEGSMRVAENYFDLRKFQKAIETYALILTNRESIFYEIALYKTAWSYYRLGDYKQAIESFTKVVALGKPAAGEIKGTGLEAERQRQLQNLHNESIIYLALSFSEEGGPQAVVPYFEKAGLSGYTVDVLRSLCDIYFQTLRYNETIEATRIYLSYSPYQPDGPKYQARVVEAYEKLGESQSAFVERQRLAQLFGPRSVWTEKNRGNAPAIQEARTLVEEALVYSATSYHEKAQKASDSKEAAPSREAQESYRLALEAYKTYIWDFPDSPKAYEMRFNYAEALFAMQSYEEAGFQYDKVAQMNLKDGKFLKDAAFNAVLSYEKLVKKSGVDFESEVSKMKEPKLPDASQSLSVKPVKKKEFDRSERLLLQSYDNYVLWLPKGEKVPEVSFKAALLFYFAQDFPNALRRFSDFYERFPNHRLAPSAVNYILVAYVNTQNWPEVEQWARRISKDPNLAKTFDRKDLDKLIGVSVMYQAESLRQGGNLKAASEKYMAIDKELKGNPLAARGMYNAAAIYEKEGNHAQAVATLEKLAETYPTSELADKALFHVAKSYEKQMRFDQAGTAYERLARKYPKSEYAPDALFNAAIFMESLGQYERAGQNYLDYSRQYPERKDAGDVHFYAAKAFDLAGKPERAADLYLEQVAKYNPPPDQEIECLARAGENFEKLNQDEAARKQYGRAVTVYQKNSKKTGETGRYYAGKSLFSQAEEAYDRFAAVKLHLPAKQMAKDLETKAQLLERANAVYVDVVAIGHPEWATASLYKIGKSYQEFSESLYAAPKPKGLSEAELDEYQRRLEEQAFPIEDKAVAAYEKGLQKAYELGAYGVWTQRILTQLQTYRAQKYPPMLERLPAVRLQGNYYEGGFVELQ